ncbi:VOC family protein [Saccharopolyspora indica]|uniref:VOC family protein n=1 Tax=Saccharopolyspora indica TaxID=1229659 RepID=UPI0022EB0110|nr:VOC family protein [Saccharopolyspora indica]MDA3648096.1 VOC family protein [Saccharopolyspora indica]
MLRGLTTTSFYSPDLPATKRWYTELFGIPPYMDTPGYLEWRIGDHQHEFGVIDSAYAGSELARTPSPDAVGGPAGAVAFWHVDDVPAVVAKLVAMGAKEHDAPRDRGEGFITATVVDPWGNVLGVMHNPHYLAVLGENPPAGR